jgi:hypothetical protein
MNIKYNLNGSCGGVNKVIGDTIITLKGDKGDPGEKGEKGDKGDAFTYEDFTSDQLEALKLKTDDTLTQSGFAADAATTGIRLEEIEDRIEDIQKEAVPEEVVRDVVEDILNEVVFSGGNAD